MADQRSSMQPDHTLLKILNLTLAPLPLVIVLMAMVLDVLDGRNVASTPPGALLPAGFAFLIWLPIDLGLASYGIYQALPAMSEHPLLVKIRTCTALALAGCAAWTALLLINSPFLSLVVLLLSAWPLYCVLRLDADHTDNRTLGNRLVVGVPFALFFGWQVGSLPASLSLGLETLGLLPDDFVHPFGQTLLLLLTLLLALAIAARTWNWAFALSVAWTFAGIGVRQMSMVTGSVHVAWVALACALAMAVMPLIMHLGVRWSAHLVQRRAQG